MHYPIGMRRAPLKAIVCALFCAIGVVCLSGCVEPVDLAAFVKDEDVVDNIEKGSSVDLTIDSEPGLEKGYQKVTGLNPDKYYGAIEWEVTNGVTTLLGGGVQFVRASGTLSATVGDIGSVTGGEITGLSNDHHYKVIAAQPLNVKVVYTDYVTYVTPTSVEAMPTEGIIDLPRPTGHDSSYHLTPKLPNPLTEYQIAEISADGLSRAAARALDGSIITTISAETVVHYVLFRPDTMLSTPIAPVYEFYVLKIGVSVPPPAGSITINFYKNDGTNFVHATRNVLPGYSIDLAVLTMPADPSRTGNTFDGWWTKDGSGDGIWGAEFTADSTVAILPNPMSVYAKWTADGPGGDSQITWDVSVAYSPDNVKTLTVAIKVGGITQLPLYTFSQASPPEITFEVTGASPALAANPTYSWTYRGAATPSLGTTNTLVVDFADPANYIYLNTNVPQVFDIIVGDNDGYYNATITIAVNP